MPFDFQDVLSKFSGSIHPMRDGQIASARLISRHRGDDNLSRPIRSAGSYDDRFTDGVGTVQDAVSEAILDLGS
jgi:hypothetical protein